jgi:hypothetical protein
VQRVDAAVCQAMCVESLFRRSYALTADSLDIRSEIALPSASVLLFLSRFVLFLI